MDAGQVVVTYASYVNSLITSGISYIVEYATFINIINVYFGIYSFPKLYNSSTNFAIKGMLWHTFFVDYNFSTVKILCGFKMFRLLLLLFLFKIIINMFRCTEYAVWLFCAILLYSKCPSSTFIETCHCWSMTSKLNYSLSVDFGDCLVDPPSAYWYERSTWGKIIIP